MGGSRDRAAHNEPGVMGAEAIRAAHVSKRSRRYANNFGILIQPLPYGRGSDRDPPPADPDELTFVHTPSASIVACSAA